MPDAPSFNRSYAWSNLKGALWARFLRIHVVHVIVSNFRLVRAAKKEERDRVRMDKAHQQIANLLAPCYERPAEEFVPHMQQFVEYWRRKEQLFALNDSSAAVKLAHAMERADVYMIVGLYTEFLFTKRPEKGGGLR